MTYWWAPLWASTRHNYHDDDGEESHEAVHGVLQIYARWILDKSKTGVQIIYDAGEAALTDPSGNLQTVVPIDTVFYAESDTFTVREAPTNYSELYSFLTWEVVKEDGTVVGTLDALSTNVEISAYYNDYFQKIMDDETGSELRRVIKLRAKYTKKDEYSARYTTITYDGDTFEDPAYPSGTITRQGYSRDGSARFSVTFDQLINETIVLPGANDFYMDGFTLVGWSFTKGTYAEQVAGATAEAPNLAPGARVAADNLIKTELNNDENTLYAMWQPKTYTVTVKQVIEDGVPVTTYSYPYRTDVQNALKSYGTGQSLTGSNKSFIVKTLTDNTSADLQYWSRLGHAIKIQTPSIPDSAEYSVTVSAIVIKDDGTRQILNPVDGDIYQILGNVEITYTYAPKVEVYLSKFDMTSKTTPVTGAKFTLTPVRFDSLTQNWVQLGNTVFEADLTSSNTWHRKLQEGIYRVVETTAPSDYAAITEPLMLTVRRGQDFSLRTVSGAAVGTDLAELSKTDSSYNNTLKIYDRPLRSFQIKKLVEGDDFKPAGYEFSVHLTLDGAPIKNYNTGSYTTNSSGYLSDVKIKNGETVTISVPWGTAVVIEESSTAQYINQYTVATAGTNVTDADAADGDRRFSFTVDYASGVLPLVTYTNTKIPIAPTGINSDTKPFGTLFLFGGLFAILSLFLVKRRKRWMEDDEPDPDGGQGRAIAPPPSGGALPGERAIAPPGVAASPKGEDKTVKGLSPQAAEHTAPISEAPKKAGTASSSPGRGAAAREIGRRAREKILSQVILTRIRGWPATRGDPAPIPRGRSGTNRLLREGG